MLKIFFTLILGFTALYVHAEGSGGDPSAPITQCSTPAPCEAGSREHNDTLANQSPTNKEFKRADNTVSNNCCAKNSVDVDRDSNTLANDGSATGSENANSGSNQGSSTGREQAK